MNQIFSCIKNLFDLKKSNYYIRIQIFNRKFMLIIIYYIVNPENEIAT
jgi:hypothetical protein